jgi:hypothetical protein
MKHVERDQGFDRALAAIPACSLDRSGAQAQKARYREIAPFITNVRDEPMAVMVEFADDLDAAAIEEVIAVEHQCCGPVFAFEFDRPNRCLRVMAIAPADSPALELIAAGFRQRLAR